MQECNSLRNNQPETHSDEVGELTAPRFQWTNRIGIDFPMPKNSRRNAHSLSQHAPLEFIRRFVMKGGMKALSIVIFVDEFTQVRSEFFQRGILATMDFFLLERLQKAFAICVVIRVAGFAHAANHLMSFEHG
jgi:hypothetical protein